MLSGGLWGGLVRTVVAADALECLLLGDEGVGKEFGEGGMTAMFGGDGAGAGGRRSRSVELRGCMRGWNSGSEELESEVEVDGNEVSLAVMPMVRSMGEQSSVNHAG